MNLDPLTFSLSQINYLVVNLSKKNFKQTNQELTQLVSLYGLEAENQLLRCLLTEAAKNSWDTDRPGNTPSNSIHASLLAQHLASLLNHPAKSTVICRAVDQPTRTLQKILKPSNTLLNRLSRLLKLTTAEDVALSLVLRRNSSKSEIVNLTKQHLKKRFLDLVQCYLDAERGHQVERAGLQECSPEVLQTLLTNLALENFRLAAVTKDLFLKKLRIDFPREVVPIVLAPLLYPDDTQTPLEEMTTADDMAAAMMDNSLAEIIRDIGYSFTSSVEECKNNMLNFGAREPTATDVAKIISTMVRYHTTAQDGPPIQTPGNFWHEVKKEMLQGHGDGWNAEVLVQTLKELASNLNWKEVILQLDHPEFFVPDRSGLNLLFTILRLGLQSAGYPANIFPVEYLCRRWTNLEGQMSLITNILKFTDIFSFADHPFHPVSIDLLKSPPENDNKDVGTWRCLYLVELLLYASERGYYMQVQDLFKIPLQYCPDVLMLALLQISPPVNSIRQELFTTLIPIFLGNHPNSGIILHQAWHNQNPNIKPVIMHSMAEWYIRGDYDQSKLSRILDVAQDLKALSLLLNVQSFPFVIDLACLASRREYLKLDKWLTDKIRDHGEAFVSSMVKFLQRRCPLVLGKGPEEQLPKAAQLPHETITTMLACLQLCIPNVQQELQEAICNVIANCQTLILNKTRQTIAGIARPHTRVLETPFNPAGLGGPLFPPHVDSITNLTPNVANMSLGAPPNTAFAMPGTLGPLVTTPGSPSRLMGAGPNSPFAMMPLQHNANVANMGLARMAPAPAMDKPRIPDPIHFPEIMHNVAKEIEDEANGYFQRIYNHPPHPTLSIDEVLDMLKKFQDSPNKREREVFSCMLRNLFEEYKFFPQYPDKELHITAQLFGGIIEKGLVPSYVSLGLALRFVLDALRKPEGSKMYYFGIAALDRFKSRLKDYHKYCEHVRAIPHFSEFPPHLIEYVEYGLNSQEPASKPQGAVLPTSLAAIFNPIAAVTVSAPYRAVAPAISVISKVANCSTGGMGSRPSIANATNIDTLLTATDREEKINAPPEPIQDKTAFIFNNLSQLNLQTKCEELKEIITEDYHAWLSQYLVMKRASIELNFHALYSNFLDVLKIREVNKMVTKETYRNIKVLLRSDKGIANFSDRSLLKNLGHWLGMLTLARNEPILHVDIDLKALVLEAYHKGQQELLYVVPFVAKVLESCAKSIVFKPPNPWTMALMNVLAELHQEPDLKLNLKFEIEVLCKNLGLDIANLKPAIYLKDPEKVRQIEFQLSQPKQNKEAAVVVPVNQAIIQAPQMQMMPPQPPMIAAEDMTVTAPTPTSGLMGDPGLMGVLGLPEPRFNYLDVNVSSTSAFGQKICFNPHILLFQNYPHLKQFVKPAIERSIQEWIHPVVDRSIKYALTTCEQIIRKDFALDPDEVRMRTCAHHMMRNLTAGMAMITCREQIISTISTNLKGAFATALMPSTPQQKEVIESAAAVLATENMELACAFIQKTAVEKALPELDKRLMADYELRKLARQEGRRYLDPMVLAYQTERLPERVRVRVGGPVDVQITVYEEFAYNIPGFTPVRDVGLFIPKPSAQEQMSQLTFSQVINPTQVYGTDEMSALITAAELFLANCINNAALAVQAANMHSLLECLCIARRNRDFVSGCALLQKAVEGLLDGHIMQPNMGSDHQEMMGRYRDTHLRVLKLLEDARVYGHVWTTKQITCCLTECREELRYNIEAVDVLIRNHLVNLPQYDLALAHMMDSGNNYMAVAFAMQLVQLYLVDDRNNIFVSESDLYHVTETLLRVMSHSRQPPPEGLGSLIEMLRVNQDPSAYLGERSPLGPTAHIHSGILQVRSQTYDDPPGLQEKTENLLREWRNVLLSPLTEIEFAQNFNLYVHRMNMNGILKTDDMITRFFRIATQMCVENVYTQLSEDRMNAPPLPPKRDKYYSMCDAFIKLVSLLIKNTADGGNPTPKLNLLNKILGIIAGCLLQDHEEHGTNFQQLPYHRLLLILFLDMNMAEPVLESMNYQVLTAFCHTRKMADVPLLLITFLSIILSTTAQIQDHYHTPRIGSKQLASCYNSEGIPQRCIPEFENAAFMVQMEATNTCGDNGGKVFCIQTSAGTSTRSCDSCQAGQFSSYYLTDLHYEQDNQTWWQSETMKEGIQYPNQVNLTLHLGKAYDITYVRIVFYSPRPQSFAIYKKTDEERVWEPFQYFSASCRDTYGVQEQRAAELGAETRALCTSEYSDISPLTGGNVLFSTLEGRPSAFTFDNSPELQEWVTATDLRISLDRLNTFGDEIFGDVQVLQSYWYAIADVAVGARCKCNGHASVCETQELSDGTRTRACRCEHNTAGRDCERCLDFYNDAPWGRASPTNVHECKACNCNGFSNKCEFDKDLYERTGHGGRCKDCAENRDGANCERCKENFFQGSGDICLPCNCNPTGSRSLQCNAEGKCQCKPGVTGDKCDVCAPNHYEFTAQGCKPCGCNESGSYANTPQCDPQTGVCLCKQNVEGRRCRECKPGFFNLDINNEFGCTPCFCFGHSSQCSSAPKYQAHETSAHFIRDAEKWAAEDEQERPAKLQFNANTQNIAVSSQGSETLYFIASSQFLGDQRPSYNHDLKFSMRLGEVRGYPSAQDIILEGPRASVSINIYAQNNPEPTNQAQEYTFRLHEDPRYGWSPTLSNFEFMSLLQNLTAIKIRGTYNKPGEGYMMNFKLETAKVGREKGSEPANWVEKCSCPKAYVGDYCEECAPGFKHEPANGGPYSACIPCDCNGHAHICDTATGFCICKHNTTGSNCELCAKGFYGNAIAGTSEDCKPCPCPKDSGCIQLMDGSIVCTDCPEGYAGPKCEVCADGYFGDPTGQFGPPKQCELCQCNGNVDPNAVGNCNRTTGECLKCIYNTAGEHCDKCLSGYFGDALDPKKKGDCKPCQCHEAGTVESAEGPPQCDGLTGFCSCHPHVIGRNCDKCEDGYFNINSGAGCETCDCNLEGSYNNTCDPFSGQCYCKPGIDGKHCDVCRAYHYGFSVEGCRDCDCDEWGSTNYQCDMAGQCSCQENVEGRRCDRCMENKKRRADGQGCEDCPPCYNLVQDAVNQHRRELRELDDILSKISKSPTVVENADFDNELQQVRSEIERLAQDAQAELGNGPGASLTDNLAELADRLADVRNMLFKIEDESYDGNEAVEKSKGNVSKAEDTIEAAQKEINSALEYMDGEGAAALAKARNRSDQFGKQSVDMSALAKESRLLAEKLENEAKNIREIADKAFNTSITANRIAKDGITKQANISNEVQILTNELNAASGKLNSMTELADQALKRAKEVYDEALGLYAEVNTTLLPDIKLNKLKETAREMNKTIDEKSSELEQLMSDNENTLDQLETAIKQGRGLLDQGHDRQDELNDLLARLDELQEQARTDVELTNQTLKDANEIYKTLKEFSDQVTESRQLADQAALDVPAVQQKIAAAEDSINSITEQLYTASDKAKDARDLAQQAQKECADKASKAASEVRKKSTTAKAEASKLRFEAEKLSTRVQETAAQIGSLEKEAADNMQLTRDAKMKVGQANTDAREAKKQVSKGLEDLKVIMDELQNLPTLDDQALDRLQESLDKAESDLIAVDLDGKIKSLTEAKNNHQRWMKQYEDEHDHLRLEVANIKDIFDQLPDGCFKRIVLEPTEGPSRAPNIR